MLQVAFSPDHELVDNPKEGFFLHKYDIVLVGSLSLLLESIVRAYSKTVLLTNISTVNFLSTV